MSQEHLALLKRLDEAGVEYCILHGWENLAEHMPSDLDIAVRPEDMRHLERVLRSLNDASLVQVIEYESSCYSYTLAVRNSGGVQFIAVDAAVDHREEGRIFFTCEQLLAGRRQSNGLWVAAASIEYPHLLAKKVSKGHLPDHQRARLRDLQGQLPESGKEIAQGLFSPQHGERVSDWIARGDWLSFEDHLPELKRALRRTVLGNSPMMLVHYWIAELGRIWRRWKRPEGLFIAVLGLEGSGKSTLVTNLGEKLAGLFRRTVAFHLRPQVLWRNWKTGPVIDPHGKPSYPWLVSLLKIPYYLLHYLLGYWVRVRPKLVRSNLVIFDRYYDDLVVDPKRYRYGGPTALVRFARSFIPRPDLYLILDVPASEALSRKSEIPHVELALHREAYLRLASELPNAMLLDGSLAIEEVARNARAVILDYLTHRYAERRHISFCNHETADMGWLTSVLRISED